MNVTTALARWSRASNRRRALEVATRGIPWLAAAGAATWAALDYGGTVAGGITGGGAFVALVVGGVLSMRRVWRVPASMAKAVDHEQGTADLLQSALAIETRGPSADEPLETVVVAQARARVPKLEANAVAPIRLRLSGVGAAAAVAAAAVTLLVAATEHGSQQAIAAPVAPHDEVTIVDEQMLKELQAAAEAIANDLRASPEARAEAKKAAEALKRAAEATTAGSAMAEMSKASRALDAAARKMAADRMPSAEGMAAMSLPQLAEELARATAESDAERLASLAREAMRRASMSPEEAAALGAALEKAAAAQAQKQKDAAAQSGQDGPKGENGQQLTKEQQEEMMRRLQKLGAAGERMKAGDNVDAEQALRALQKLMRDQPKGGSPADQRQQQAEDARRRMAQMQAGQRAMMNGASPSDARAQAMRAGSMGQQMAGQQGDQRGQGMQPGQGQGSQPGNGQTPGQGQGTPGNGQMPGQGQTPGNGQMPGNGQAGQMGNGQTPGSGQVQSGNPPSQQIGAGQPRPDQIGVISGHGSAGTSGMSSHTPHAAGTPSAFSAEQVSAPAAVTPEGAVRAIAELSAGEHVPTGFERVRDHYEAIAESAIRRDDIPLTRRELIQRYFTVLRNHETEAPQ